MEVTIVTYAAGDWMGIYVDGQLKSQGHEVPYWDILKAVGIPHKSIEVDLEDTLPADLKDL